MYEPKSSRSDRGSNVTELGELMTESHQSLQFKYEVSSPALTR